MKTTAPPRGGQTVPPPDGGGTVAASAAHDGTVPGEKRDAAVTGLTAAALVALVLAVAALILVSRGDSDPAPTVDGGGSAAPGTITASLREFAIDLSSPQLVAGQATITLDNVGLVEHDLLVEGTGFSSAHIPIGGSGTLAVDLEPGTWTLYCSIAGHRQAGMETTLTVVAADGTVDPASDDGHGGHGAAGEVDWAAMDELMLASVAAFPAETEGIGNQPLEPEILPDGTKRFELTASIIEWEVSPGEVVEGWAYNGQIPGPAIRLDVGDRVEMVINNELPMGTDVHWHGIIVPNSQDGVSPLTQELIPPGGTYTYEFTVDEPAVSMYHPHHHAHTKIPNGMWGTIIVGDVPLPEGRTIGGVQLPDEIVVAQELPMVVNDAGTIGLSLNGKSFPATHPIVAQEGDWLLIHYYNEGLQIHPMHLHGQPQLVVAKDGFPLDAPRWEDTVNVAPGERFSVLVHAKDPGVWVFHCHILTHAEANSGMFGMVTALIVE